MYMPTIAYTFLERNTFLSFIKPAFSYWKYGFCLFSYCWLFCMCLLLNGIYVVCGAVMMEGPTAYYLECKATGSFF